MHNNYYFLRQLSASLEKKITGFTLVSCFSQNKDELVTEFNNGTRSFFIKASLQGDFQCLSFPGSFHRARKNSVDLFSNLLMKNVSGIRQFSNERSLGIVLENKNTLVFKMHGARANALWFAGDIAQEIFRNNFNADLTLKLNELDRIIDWSYEAFLKNRADYKVRYSTFGKPVWDFLAGKGFEAMDAANQWKQLQDIRNVLENPKFFLTEKDHSLALSLLPAVLPSKIYTDPIEALNDFFHRKVSTSAFQKEKSVLLTDLHSKLKQSESYLKKARQNLTALSADSSYHHWADLIMANLQSITPRQEKVILPDFDDLRTPVEIRLKPELSPQKNAEMYYLKAKNQVIEIRTLKESIDRKEKEILGFNEWIEKVNQVELLAGLKDLSAAIKKISPARQTQISLPYHEFEFMGFTIWVGKNATANDALTQKHSFKDDLWLHAKDVAGSHVLLKYQSGKSFPKDVIQRAAQLAAWYSKRKNESLCPVAITPKKFVRKRKGDPAGTVVVEREEVVMVQPVK